MELAELKTFATVVAEHSFSLAAIRLCRTQPAVSQAIRRLEEDLGERLFDRRAKQPTLTPAGDALLPEAIRLLKMADEAAARIRQLSQRDRAVLRIGANEAATHVLLPALPIFLAKHPDVSIEFRCVTDLDTLGEVGAGTIDIGVTTRDRVPAPLASVQVPILSAGFCVLLPTRHPLASRHEIPMTMLHSARLVTLAGVPSPAPVATDAASDSALPRGSLLVMPGIDSLKQAVANGLGIGIVPRLAISRLTANTSLVVIPLSASPTPSTLTLVYRGNDGRPNAVEGFVDVLRRSGEDCISRKASIALRVSR